MVSKQSSAVAAVLGSLYEKDAFFFFSSQIIIIINNKSHVFLIHS